MKRYLFRLSPVLLALALSGCRPETITPGHATEQTVPVDGDLCGVWFTTPNEGYISGGRPWSHGFLLKTTDGGRHWAVDTLVNDLLECVRFDPAGRGFACGLDGLILERLADGSGWLPFRQDWTWYKACAFPDGRRGVAVSSNGYGRGETFTFGPDVFWRLDTLQQFTRALSDVWFSDSVTVHTCGLGWLARSDDAGRTWQRLPPTGDFFEALHFPTPDTGYCCGASGSLLKTTDSGRTWRPLPDGSTRWGQRRALRAVYFVSADKGYVAGDAGLLWRTTDGGRHWARVKGAPEDADFNAVFAFDDRGWAVGRDGMVFYFEE